MKYDIYFHSDFDGRASAAVMLAFLRSRGDGIARYVSMNYGYEKVWLRSDLSKKEHPAIVVDFQYHPKAAWWFDHHATGIKNPVWRRRFRPDLQHRLETRYRSCAHLVYDVLRRDFGWKPPKHFAELVKWLDIIDGAGYSSAKSTVEMREPALLMNAFIEALPHTAAEDAKMIRLLAERPIAAVVRAPVAAPAIRTLKAKVKKSLAYYRRNLRISGKVSFIDLTSDPLNGLMRFTPFYLHPRSAYGIRMKRKGPWWYLGVGANPWYRGRNGKDLGAIMGRYGGGGHKGVAAAEFRTKEKALAALRDLQEMLG